ncbi:MAG TPA: hydrogenase iron-sulfur subunit [Steroidobacter sp.]|nr:hydrogenase iron-sulfur subunit [Steroidobacter sp.]
MNIARRCALTAWSRCERGFDGVFGGSGNPLRHLGALAALFFFMLAVSGAYLYAVLDTSAEGAYRSIEQLTLEQPALGGVLRSVHRYAADAFILIILAHLLREWVLGRFTGFRRYAWLTGVPLLVFAQTSGVGGFWLSWDRLAQFSALATAEWLDWLPVFGIDLTRNFASADAVSARLFSLFIFVHIGVSLTLLFGLWFHVQRLARPQVFPPRALTIGVCGALLSLAAAAPIVGQGAADLATTPTVLALDWVLLFVHPLMYATSPGFVWAVFGAAVLVLLATPFATRVKVEKTAQVNAENCNGCGYCFEDCPYAAITMQAHPSMRPGARIAQVQSDLCASCGICVGACPSATPFRSTRDLVSGVEMPQARISVLRDELERRLASPSSEGCIVVFGCDRGARVSALAGAQVATFSLICTAMLPPSFIEYSLRRGAAAVLVTGCGEGACEFRLGQRWTEERLSGAREPHLRTGVRDRVCIRWAGRGQEEYLRAAIKALQSGADGCSGGSVTAQSGREQRS